MNVKVYQCPMTGDKQTLEEFQKDFDQDEFAKAESLTFEEWLGGELIEVDPSITLQ